MISIIDSVKEVLTERFSILKLLCIILPSYYCFILYNQSKIEVAIFNIIAYITLFFTIGILIQISGNVINEKLVTIPPINPVKLALSSIKGIVGLGPIIFISIIAANYVCSFINAAPQVENIIKIIVWLIALSLILTSYLSFCEKERIIDAYKIFSILKKSGDIFILLVLYIIQLILVNVVTSGVIGYIIVLLFGTEQFFIFFLVFAFVINLAIAAHYFANAYTNSLGYRSSFD